MKNEKIQNQDSTEDLHKKLSENPDVEFVDSRTIRIKLTGEPIRAHGELLDELTLKRPKAKILKKFDAGNGDVATGFEMISEIAGIPPSSVDDLEMQDWRVCSDVVSYFLDSSLKTGRKSSLT